jgi:hypothetical protein
MYPICDISNENPNDMDDDNNGPIDQPSFDAEYDDSFWDGVDIDSVVKKFLGIFKMLILDR